MRENDFPNFAEPLYYPMIISNLNIHPINFLKGLEYLYKNCLVNMTHEDIAAFLYNEEGLNKVKKGEYLGEK